VKESTADKRNTRWSPLEDKIVYFFYSWHRREPSRTVLLPPTAQNKRLAPPGASNPRAYHTRRGYSIFGRASTDRTQAPPPQGSGGRERAVIVFSPYGTGRRSVNLRLFLAVQVKAWTTPHTETQHCRFDCQDCSHCGWQSARCSIGCSTRRPAAHPTRPHSNGVILGELRTPGLPFGGSGRVAASLSPTI